MASQPNSSSGGYEMSQDEKRHKSRRWRSLFAIAIASCLLALIAAPLWSLIADHRQSIITDDTTTATTVDTDSRRTKPNPDEMHFISGNFLEFCSGIKSIREEKSYPYKTERNAGILAFVFQFRVFT
jgi:uncharacterized surface anchored protein